MLRRLARTAVLSLIAVAALPSVAHADPLFPLPLPPTFASPDRLTVTVTGAEGEIDGTYRLVCNPAGGSHPNAAGACDRLKDLETEGRTLFTEPELQSGSTGKGGAGKGAPGAPLCTMQYGGPATARITGTWHNRAVDVTYDRGNGCAISRWDELVPVLPQVGRG